MNAVDTNVLVYATDRRDPSKQQGARDLLASLDGGVLLWQVACEFIAATRKLASDGYRAEDAWANLADFIEMLKLVTPTAHVLERVRALHTSRGVAFWDAMIYASCLDAGVTRIYSEDLPGAPIPGLEVVNPFTLPSPE